MKTGTLTTSERLDLIQNAKAIVQDAINRGWIKHGTFARRHINITGQLTLKQWCMIEGQREGISPCSVYARYARGKYPHIKTRKKNKRVIYVL